jgi:signal transduction histidine kinase
MKKGSLLPPLLFGAAVLVVSLFGLVNLTGRPGIRSEYLLRPIIGLDAYEIRGPIDVRFVLSRKRVGDPVEIRFGPDGGPAVIRDTVIPFYSQAPFPFAFALLAGFSFLAGFGVLLVKSSDRRARIFYWLCLSFGAAVMIGGSTWGVQGRTVNLLPGVLFNFAYPMTLALLLWFARSYAPHRRLARPSLFWIVPAAWGLFLCATFLVSELVPSIEAYRIRSRGFHLFRLYIVVMGVLALVEFARAYRSSRSEEDRGQIKWYFVGLAVGLGSYLFLNQLPVVMSDKPLLSESFSGAFFFLLPVFMATVMLQFRLLRVNIVFHRGLVYAILTVFTLCAYLFTVDALRLLFPHATAAGNTLILVGTAVAVALLLSPGRRTIQDGVERVFFGQAHDFKKALQRFKGQAPSLVDAGGLKALFEATLTPVMPVSGLGFVLREAPGQGSVSVWSSGMEAAALAALAGLPAGAKGPWARADKVRGVRGADLSQEGLLASAGAAMVLAVPRGARTQEGLLALGPKASGHRFTPEDVDFLEVLAGDLAVNLDRLRIQEEMIYERASREKTEELVRMKTEFISALSHELRTPMTSLIGLSGLLSSGKVADPAKRERLLGLMAGECGRLARFLTNVLDYGKIERDAKAYAFRDVELGPLVREVADLVGGGTRDGGVRIEVEIPDTAIAVRADPDAVRQAVLNLVDNAVKHNPEGQAVTVSLAGVPDAAVISVKDRGTGIAPEDRQRIFEAFYRSPQALARDPTGVGLGLKIVHHIMAAHGGRVDVASEPGQGSVFSLFFPL